MFLTFIFSCKAVVELMEGLFITSLRFFLISEINNMVYFSVIKSVCYAVLVFIYQTIDAVYLHSLKKAITFVIDKEKKCNLLNQYNYVSKIFQV